MSSRAGAAKFVQLSADTANRQNPVADPPMAGRSAAIQALIRRIASLRENESNVLIEGESGTGKELVARAVHDASPRRAGPFVPVDCGALPESIIESELFGHRKGAFTGATGAQGLFRMAEGGTIFLDEIGEIPAAVQAKLLRALQHKEVRPVGAASAIPVDIRVVAATHRDLAEMVDAGSFRMDLYYRLNVVKFTIPPLRERSEDIEPIARHFVAKHGRSGESISRKAVARLECHPWPGNARELENAIESALAFASGKTLEASDFPGLLPGKVAPAAGVDGTDELPLSLEAYERAALVRALAEAGGDVTRAAFSLGIGRSTLYRKLGKHGIQVEKRPRPPHCP
jgi:DNA-binding NtrC family response regulator